jgi:hypothetical protein
MTDSYSFGERAYYSTKEVRAIHEDSFFHGWIGALCFMFFIALSAYVCDIRLTYKGSICHVDSFNHISSR